MRSAKEIARAASFPFVPEAICFPEVWAGGKSGELFNDNVTMLFRRYFDKHMLADDLSSALTAAHCFGFEVLIVEEESHKTFSAEVRYRGRRFPSGIRRMNSVDAMMDGMRWVMATMQDTWNASRLRNFDVKRCEDGKDPMDLVAMRSKKKKFNPFKRNRWM